jgi:hypothetical protein
MATTNSGVFDLTGIDVAGNLTTKGIAQNAYNSIQHRYYASSGFTGTWTGLTLLNGWVVYSGFAVPQYIKGSDGIVTVKGLIGSGTAGTVVANLPAGYRPKEIILTTDACNLAYCRFDVYPDGRIIAQAGASSTWSALEGITFMAEQ